MTSKSPAEIAHTRGFSGETRADVKNTKRHDLDDRMEPIAN
jgi:hypothetical protein